jgi:cytidylate kinase
MLRVLTVAREYGSGGAAIARKISDWLGWELLDNALILEIARASRVDPELVRRYDERVDSWLHRVSRRGLWHGAFEGVAAVADEDIFDAETMAEMARHLIEAAYERGNCVIVGRGAQCLLQDRRDVLHVFIHAPWHERIARVRQRIPAGIDIEELIRSTDRQRAEYIRMHFGCDWSDPHLYHMLISSELGEEEVSSLVMEAVLHGGGRVD